MKYYYGLNKVLQEIKGERNRQDHKWGEQNWPDGTRRVLYEYSAKVAKTVCDENFKNKTLTWKQILHEEVLEAFTEEDSLKLREELIQVAAVAVAWIECIDRNLTK
jgi:hypothetical protein